jgi:murein DD-endopeptidase MepM/ murein hydrolase activator NlpD
LWDKHIQHFREDTFMPNKSLSEAQYIQISEKKQQQQKQSKMAQRIVTSLVLLFSVVFLIMGGVSLISATSNAYVLTVDGEEVATFVSKEEADQALELCVANINNSEAFNGYDLQLTYANKIDIKQVSATGVVYSSVGESAVILADVLDFVAEAAAIMINGKEVLYVADNMQAIDAVNAAKNYYADPKEDATIMRVYTAEEISVTDAEVSLDRVLSLEEATNTLLFGAKAKSSATQPLITVNVERTKTETEVLPYNTVKQENSALARGEEKVISQGEDGVQNVTYKVLEVNGVKAGAEAVTSEVVVPAVDAVMEVGTQYYIASRSDSGGSGNVGWPADGVISSPFGWRSRGWHSGIDIAAPVGTTIFAAEAGTVVDTKTESGYGMVVRIDHGDGMVTVYAHCSEFFVSEGDSVDRNTAIAAIGMTGTTTGPHVHFEVRIDGQALNPMDYLQL